MQWKGWLRCREGRKIWRIRVSELGPRTLRGGKRFETLILISGVSRPRWPLGYCSSIWLGLIWRPFLASRDQEGGGEIRGREGGWRRCDGARWERMVFNFMVSDDFDRVPEKVIIDIVDKNSPIVHTQESSRLYTDNLTKIGRSRDV